MGVLPDLYGEAGQADLRPTLGRVSRSRTTPAVYGRGIIPETMPRSMRNRAQAHRTNHGFNPPSESFAHTAQNTQNRRRAAGPVGRIVVPVGGTQEEHLAQEHAIELASALQVPILGVHVTPDPQEIPSRMFHFLNHHARAWGVAARAVVVSGNSPAENIVSMLNSMDLVVIGTRRLGTRYHMGSIAQHMVRCAPGFVQVVRLPAA